jgi:alcohol dehydrogenase
MVMRAVIGTSPDCDGALRDIFGPDLEAGAERLAGFLTGLGVSLDPADYSNGEAQWDELIDLAFAGERGKNFIGTQERVTAVARAGFADPATKLRRAAGNA